MRNKKQYRIDLWLFVGSVTTLVFILFSTYVHAEKMDNTSLIKIMDFITIPIILFACIIPLVVVFRFISKKTDSRTLSMMAVLFSLMTAILISYLTVV